MIAPDRSLPLAGGGRAAGTRDAAFSYECHRCLRCCRGRAIQLNPYEVLRLARNRAIDTGAFVDRFVDLGRMALRNRGDGTCVFLGPEGCEVHADRPLACRLYPLGRIVRGDRERWVELPAADGSEGVRSVDGSVADYVASQGAEPFMAAADAYHQLLETCLLDDAWSPPTEDPVADPARWLLDVDGALGSDALDADEGMRRHLELLRAGRWGCQDA